MPKPKNLAATLNAEQEKPGSRRDLANRVAKTNPLHMNKHGRTGGRNENWQQTNLTWSTALKSGQLPREGDYELRAKNRDRDLEHKDLVIEVKPGTCGGG
jgi:hypothetical protein